MNCIAGKFACDTIMVMLVQHLNKLYRRQICLRYFCLTCKMDFNNEIEIEDVYICLFERSHNIDNEETDFELETNKKNTNISIKNNKSITSIPPSNFLPFQHLYPLHQSSVLLPS